MLNIFRYIDYRKFLKDFYEAKKRENPHFSHRYIANKLNFDSGYFTKIIKTERHISINLAQKFAEFCKMGDREADYFLTLVLFAKAGTQAEKERQYEKLLSFKQSEAAIMSHAQYRIFDQWYYLAIRELLACFEFTGDFADLGRRVQPAISGAKARRAVEELERIGFVKKNGAGVYERIEPVWTTNREMESVAVNKMQMAMLDRAREAYDRFGREARDMSTLTLSVSDDEYRRMTGELALLRNRFLEMARNSQRPDRVYQLNVSLFPLSKVPKAGTP
jgi:uncharacterized protein (TIGR02147 family)